MIIDFLNFLKGNIVIEVEGAGLERFLNLCAARDIAFWDIKRISPEKIRATIKIRGFFALRPYARKSMCKIHVIKKTGAPFIAHRYGKRPGLWGGAILCLAFLYVMTCFVWTIDVEGCENIDPAEIRTMLQNYGLKPGTWRSSVEPDQIKLSIMTDRDDLAFFAVNFDGTRAVVTLRERDGEGNIVLDDEPCDVISTKTGVIAALRVLAGTAKTEVGHTIEAGDVIAAGTVESADGDVWYVHASAEADIRTWYTLSSRMTLDVKGTQRTENTKVRRAIVIGSRRLNLYFVESDPFACYDKKSETKMLTLPGGLVLPIGLVTETYTELNPVEATMNLEKCASVLEMRLRQAFAQTHPDAQVLLADFSMEQEGNSVVGTLKLECMETTGVSVPLGGTE